MQYVDRQINTYIYIYILCMHIYSVYSDVKPLVFLPLGGEKLIIEKFFF